MQFGCHIIESEKMHSMVHSDDDVANFCDSIDFSAEAPETAHKKWTKEQGGNTNWEDSSKFIICFEMNRNQVLLSLK